MSGVSIENSVMVLSIGLLIAACCGTADASVIFYDDFEDSPAGNAVSPNNWDVFSGTVDIGDSKDEWWDPGVIDKVLDLEGSHPYDAGAIIKTKEEFNLGPGTYRFSFRASGSEFETESPSDTFSWGLEEIFTETETYSWDTYAHYVTYDFELSQAKTSRIFFDQDHATDYYGIRIDNVKLEFLANPVPEPATIAVWSILGLSGIGYGVRRKVKKA